VKDTVSLEINTSECYIQTTDSFVPDKTASCPTRI